MPLIQFEIDDDLDIRLFSYTKRRRMLGEKITKAKACLKLISEALKNYE